MNKRREGASSRPLNELLRTAGLSRAAVAKDTIEAPHTAASCRNEQEDEAIQDRRIAAVQDRIEAAWRMGDPVGRGHEAGENEGHRTNEEARDQKRSADEFQNACNPGKAEGRRPGIGRDRETEKLLRAMRHEDEGGDDAQDAEQARCPNGFKVSGIHEAVSPDQKMSGNRRSGRPSR